MQSAEDTGVEPNDGLTEALASIPSEPEPSGADEADKSDGEGPPRDEHGRFAKAQAEAEAVAKEADKGNGEDRDGGQIPSWRLREIREERDRIAAAHEADRRELETLKRERAQWQERQRQMREAEQAPQAPDPIADPQGYQAFVDQQVAARFQSVEQQMRNWRVNMTFADQHEQHGEAFEKAMQALESSRDKEAIQSVMEAINPGKALMKWHRKQAAMAEVGDDLDGYNAKLRAKLKADPEFRKEFMAEMEAEARGNSGRSAGNVTDLPSLNRAPGGGGRQSLGVLANANTDAEIYSELTARRR
jgi:hypothetical protein